MTNPHRFDFHPDKYIAGVSAQLTAEEQGVYWMVCALIMSHRGPIQDDPIRIGKLCLVSKRRAERILSSIASKGKIERVSGEIRQKTAETSVKRAQNIIETYRKNGLNGGRPSNNIKGLSKASGFENNGPPNLNLKPKPNPSKEESNQERASPDGEANKIPSRSNGTRLPENWEPTEEEKSYAIGLGIDPVSTAEDFKDHWLSKAGAAARKVDWGRTWKTWCRRAVEFKGRKTQTKGGNGFIELIRSGKV